MNIRSFVGTSASLLVAWLGATYLYEIPPERYPKQDRTSASFQMIPADQNIADLKFTQR